MILHGSLLDPHVRLATSPWTHSQELIDDIIDRLPRQEMPPCSLVARRWRERSQKHYFDSVTFSSEHQMVLWDANIPKDTDGIPSYVHHVQVRNIRSWHYPAVCDRVLNTFSSMESLAVSEVTIPHVQKSVGTALTRPRFACTSLCLDMCDEGLMRLIELFSETIVTLALHGRQLVRVFGVKEWYTDSPTRSISLCGSDPPFDHWRTGWTPRCEPPATVVHPHGVGDSPFFEQRY